MSDAIRVLLVDDHDVVRLGLRALLSGVADIEIVGEAGNGEEALAACERLQPDIVVLDLSMKGMDGAEVTRELRRRGSPAKVLVLTMHDEEEYLIPLLEAGAQGYLVKREVSAELVGAVRTVAAGRTFVRAAAAEVLAAGWARRAQEDERRTRFEQLSEREKEVFLLIAQGFATTQIGERLFISAKTVDTYRRRINDKTGLSERAEYVRLALELGLLTADSVPDRAR